MNVSELKLNLLFYGIRIDMDSIKSLTYKKDKHFHNDRHFIGKSHRDVVPQEIILVDDSNVEICVSVLLRPDSPYLLSYNEYHLNITYKGKRLDIDVKFIPEPSFWKRETKDGTPTYNLLSLPGINELSLWSWNDCTLQYERNECAFCTTTQTSIRYKTSLKSNLLSAFNFKEKIDIKNFFSKDYPILLNRSTDALTSALQLDFKLKEYWFTIISGNLTEHLLDFQHKIASNLISDLLRTVPSLDKNKVVINIMPPNNKIFIESLKKSGAKYYMSNLELWNVDYFKSICPGKWIYGRNKFINMLEYAVTIFGRGNVWCNFVSGIELLKYQLEGFHELAKNGIVSGANVFHKDPSVKIDFMDDITVADLKQFYIDAASILKDNNLMPFYGLKSRRSSLLWEAYLGYLN